MTTATIESEANTGPAGLTLVSRLRDLKLEGGEGQEGFNVDPRTITVEDGFNPRDFNSPEARAHLEALKASIKALGVKRQIWVRLEGPKDAKKVILVDGECRLRAVMELIAEGEEILSVPVIQKSIGVTSIADRLVLAMTANEGLPLNQLEVGKTYQRLVAYGWTPEKIAAQAGKTDRYVRDALSLAEAPDAVRALVASGAVTKARAIKEVKEHGETATETLLEAVKESKTYGNGKKVTAPKKDKKQSKLAQIAVVMDEYEETEPTEVTKDKLIRWMGDIADIMGENEAAFKN
jgi:ParB family transcriptional regulator, chromosome partitioning protein